MQREQAITEEKLELERVRDQLVLQASEDEAQHAALLRKFQVGPCLDCS